MAKRKSTKLKVNSIRVYYLDEQDRIDGERKQVFGIGDDAVKEYRYTTSENLGKWALRQVKPDRSRNYKFEVRTTKGRFLFDK